MKNAILTLIILLACLMYSCSSDDSNPTNNSKPEPWEKQSIIIIDSVNYNYDYGEGNYNTDSKKTEILIASSKNRKDSSVTITIIFNGNNPGEYPVGSKNNIIIKLENKTYSSSNGSITITDYGEVGNEIKGTFTGLFYTSAMEDSVRVTSAEFKALRNSDLTSFKNDGNKFAALTLDFSFHNGTFLNVTDKKIAGTATYLKINKTGIVKLYIADIASNNFLLTSDLMIYSDSSIQNIPIIQSLEKSYMKVEINKAPYYLVGNVNFTKFAGGINDYYEMECTGKIYTVATGIEAGIINKFTIKVKRDQ